MSESATNSTEPELSPERRLACLEAAWEVDALARVLPDLVPADESGAYLQLRGIAGRMLRLAYVMSAGLGDGDVSTRKLEQIIHLDKGAG